MNSLRISRAGRNAITSTSPNDFIFNSDYNSPKIVSEVKSQPTHADNGGTESFYSYNHGLSYTPFVFAFCKFDNSRVGLPGTKQSNADFWFTNLRVNNTNVSFGYANSTGGNAVPYWKYLATELPLAGTPSFTEEHGNRLIIARDGNNVFTQNTNPNLMQFDSRWKSLKYFMQNESLVSIPLTDPTVANTTYSYEQVLVNHNLGYYPFFQCFILYEGDTIYSSMPDVFSDAGFWSYHFIYTTTTQIIYRFEGGDSFGGNQAGGYNIKLYWKIFSFDLDL